MSGKPGPRLLGVVDSATSLAAAAAAAASAAAVNASAREQQQLLQEEQRANSSNNSQTHNLSSVSDIVSAGNANIVSSQSTSRKRLSGPESDRRPTRSDAGSQNERRPRTVSFAPADDTETATSNSRMEPIDAKQLASQLTKEMGGHTERPMAVSFDLTVTAPTGSDGPGPGAQTAAVAGASASAAPLARKDYTRGSHDAAMKRQSSRISVHSSVSTISSSQSESSQFAATPFQVNTGLGRLQAHPSELEYDELVIAEWETLANQSSMHYVLQQAKQCFMCGMFQEAHDLFVKLYEQTYPAELVTYLKQHVGTWYVKSITATPTDSQPEADEAKTSSTPEFITTLPAELSLCLRKIPSTCLSVVFLRARCLQALGFPEQALMWFECQYVIVSSLLHAPQLQDNGPELFMTEVDVKVPLLAIRLCRMACMRHITYRLQFAASRTGSVATTLIEPAESENSCPLVRIVTNAMVPNRQQLLQHAPTGTEAHYRARLCDVISFYRSKARTLHTGYETDDCTFGALYTKSTKWWGRIADYEMKSLQNLMGQDPSQQCHLWRHLARYAYSESDPYLASLSIDQHLAVAQQNNVDSQFSKRGGSISMLLQAWDICQQCPLGMTVESLMHKRCLSVVERMSTDFSAATPSSGLSSNTSLQYQAFQHPLLTHLLNTWLAAISVYDAWRQLKSVADLECVENMESLSLHLQHCVAIAMQNAKAAVDHESELPHVFAWLKWIHEASLWWHATWLVSNGKTPAAIAVMQSALSIRHKASVAAEILDLCTLGDGNDDDSTLHKSSQPLGAASGAGADSATLDALQLLNHNGQQQDVAPSAADSTPVQSKSIREIEHLCTIWLTNAPWSFGTVTNGADALLSIRPPPTNLDETIGQSSDIKSNSSLYHTMTHMTPLGIRKAIDFLSQLLRKNGPSAQLYWMRANLWKLLHHTSCAELADVQIHLGRDFQAPNFPTFAAKDSSLAADLFRPYSQEIALMQYVNDMSLMHQADADFLETFTCYRRLHPHFGGQDFVFDSTSGTWVSPAFVLRVQRDWKPNCFATIQSLAQSMSLASSCKSNNPAETGVCGSHNVTNQRAQLYAWFYTTIGGILNHMHGSQCISSVTDVDNLSADDLRNAHHSVLHNIVSLASALREAGSAAKSLHLYSCVAAVEKLEPTRQLCPMVRANCHIGLALISLHNANFTQATEHVGALRSTREEFHLHVSGATHSGGTAAYHGGGIKQKMPLQRMHQDNSNNNSKSSSSCDKKEICFDACCKKVLSNRHANATIYRSMTIVEQSLTGLMHTMQGRLDLGFQGICQAALHGSYRMTFPLSIGAIVAGTFFPGSIAYHFLSHIVKVDAAYVPAEILAFTELELFDERHEHVFERALCPSTSMAAAWNLDSVPYPWLTAGFSSSWSHSQLRIVAQYLQRIRVVPLKSPKSHQAWLIQLALSLSSHIGKLSSSAIKSRRSKSKLRRKSIAPGSRSGSHMSISTRRSTTHQSNNSPSGVMSNTATTRSLLASTNALEEAARMTLLPNTALEHLHSCQSPSQAACVEQLSILASFGASGSSVLLRELVHMDLHRTGAENKLAFDLAMQRKNDRTSTLCSQICGTLMGDALASVHCMLLSRAKSVAAPLAANNNNNSSSVVTAILQTLPSFAQTALPSSNAKENVRGAAAAGRRTQRLDRKSMSSSNGGMLANAASSAANNCPSTQWIRASCPVLRSSALHAVIFTAWTALHRYAHKRAWQPSSVVLRTSFSACSASTAHCPPVELLEFLSKYTTSLRTELYQAQQSSTSAQCDLLTPGYGGANAGAASSLSNRRKTRSSIFHSDSSSGGSRRRRATRRASVAAKVSPASASPMLHALQSAAWSLAQALRNDGASRFGESIDWIKVAAFIAQIEIDVRTRSASELGIPELTSGETAATDKDMSETAARRNSNLSVISSHSVSRNHHGSSNNQFGDQTLRKETMRIALMQSTTEYVQTQKLTRKLCAMYFSMAMMHMTLQHWPQAYHALSSVLRVDKSQALARRYRTYVAQRMCCFSQSATDLVEWLELFPHDLGGKLRLASSLLIQRGALSASRIVDEVLKWLPQEPTALFLSSCIAMSEQKFGIALQLARRSVDADATAIAPLIQQARAAELMGHAEDAASLLSSALGLDSSNIDAYFSYARLHWARRNAQDAEWCLRRVLGVCPCESNVELLLARVQLYAHHRHSATRTLTAIVERNQEHAEACFLLGYVHHIEGNCNESVSMYDRAIASEPMHIVAHYCKMVALIGAQKIESLIDYTNELLQTIAPANMKHAQHARQQISDFLLDCPDHNDRQYFAWYLQILAAKAICELLVFQPVSATAILDDCRAILRRDTGMSANSSTGMSSSFGSRLSTTAVRVGSSKFAVGQKSRKIIGATDRNSSRFQQETHRMMRARTAANMSHDTSRYLESLVSKQMAAARATVLIAQAEAYRFQCKYQAALIVYQQVHTYLTEIASGKDSSHGVGATPDHRLRSSQGPGSGTSISASPSTTSLAATTEFSETRQPDHQTAADNVSVGSHHSRQRSGRFSRMGRASQSNLRNMVSWLQLTDNELAMFNCAMGVCYALCDKPREALVRFNVALKHNDTYYIAMHNLSIMFVCEKQWNEAADWMSQALHCLDMAAEKQKRNNAGVASAAVGAKTPSDVAKESIRSNKSVVHSSNRTHRISGERKESGRYKKSNDAETPADSVVHEKWSDLSELVTLRYALIGNRALTMLHVGNVQGAIEPLESTYKYYTLIHPSAKPSDENKITTPSPAKSSSISVEQDLRPNHAADSSPDQPATSAPPSPSPSPSSPSPSPSQPHRADRLSTTSASSPPPTYAQISDSKNPTRSYLKSLARVSRVSQISHVQSSHSGSLSTSRMGNSSNARSRNNEHARPMLHYVGCINALTMIPIGYSAVDTSSSAASIHHTVQHNRSPRLVVPRDRDHNDRSSRPGSARSNNARAYALESGGTGTTGAEVVSEPCLVTFVYNYALIKYRLSRVTESESVLSEFIETCCAQILLDPRAAEFKARYQASGGSQFGSRTNALNHTSFGSSFSLGSQIFGHLNLPPHIVLALHFGFHILNERRSYYVNQKSLWRSKHSGEDTGSTAAVPSMLSSTATAHAKHAAESDEDNGIANSLQLSMIHSADHLVPLLAHGFANRGLCFQRFGDPQSALCDYRIAEALVPGIYQLYYNRAFLYFLQLSQPTQAMGDMKTYADLAGVHSSSVDPSQLLSMLPDQPSLRSIGPNAFAATKSAAAGIFQQAESERKANERAAEAKRVAREMAVFSEHCDRWTKALHLACRDVLSAVQVLPFHRNISATASTSLLPRSKICSVLPAETDVAKAFFTATDALSHAAFASALSQEDMLMEYDRERNEDHRPVTEFDPANLMDDFSEDSAYLTLLLSHVRDVPEYMTFVNAVDEACKMQQLGHVHSAETAILKASYLLPEHYLSRYIKTSLDVIVHEHLTSPPSVTKSSGAESEHDHSASLPSVMRMEVEPHIHIRLREIVGVWRAKLSITKRNRDSAIEALHHILDAYQQDVAQIACAFEHAGSGSVITAPTTSRMTVESRDARRSNPAGRTSLQSNTYHTMDGDHHSSSSPSIDLLLSDDDDDEHETKHLTEAQIAIKSFFAQLHGKYHVPWIYGLISRLYMHANNPERARDQLMSSVTNFPEHQATLYDLTCFCVATGDYVPAMLSAHTLLGVSAPHLAIRDAAAQAKLEAAQQSALSGPRLPDGLLSSNSAFASDLLLQSQEEVIGSIREYIETLHSGPTSWQNDKIQASRELIRSAVGRAKFDLMIQSSMRQVGMEMDYRQRSTTHNSSRGVHTSNNRDSRSGTVNSWYSSESGSRPGSSAFWSRPGSSNQKSSPPRQSRQRSRSKHRQHSARKRESWWNLASASLAAMRPESVQSVASDSDRGGARHSEMHQAANDLSMKVASAKPSHGMSVSATGADPLPNVPTGRSRHQKLAETARVQYIPMQWKAADEAVDFVSGTAPTAASIQSTLATLDSELMDMLDSATRF
jgi:tetratricopeptide (TPR) repeat protein